MRRSSSSPSIQLFPFLAVLVCAMGALILLLLVTTRKMRQVAVARAAAEAEATREEVKPVVPPALPPQPIVEPQSEPTPEPVPTGPTADELAEQRAQRLRDNALARKRQAARQADWQRGLVEAEIARDQRRVRLQQTEAELTELREKLAETETYLQRLADKKSQLKSDFEKESKQRLAAEREHQRLSAEILATQKALADLRRAHADAASKFAFIPYDGASGTTRRPVYIECTSAGIRFIPENEVLDENDLKGFTETFNPLLAASRELMQYWREQSVAKGEAKNLERPYLLLLVRPKGTVAYYVARKMLSQLGDDFGYELIEDDFEIQLPPADPAARHIIQRAVADALRNRAEMVAMGSRVGAPRLGEVIMGRSEEPIEFGSLDDQAAAEAARQDSPFHKNAKALARGFQVTRSPLQKDEIKASSMRAALAERQRRRLQDIPGSLAEMDGQQGQLNARSTAGTSAKQDNLPIPLTASPPPPNPPTQTGLTSDPAPTATGNGYELTDPFSRDQLATGRQGVGNISPGTSPGDNSSSRNSKSQRSERVADSKSSGQSEIGADVGDPAGSESGTTTRPRLNNSSPRGARPGKVIDIPPNAESIAPAARSSQQDPSNSDNRTANNGIQPRGMATRSTDPHVQMERIYGDNPEARQQLSSMKAKTVAQKRDAAKRRWGGTNTGQIGFERKVNVAVTPDRLIIGQNEIEVVIEPGTKPDELVEAVLSALDEHSQTWGKPPTRFYWVPYIHFDVYENGETQYQRLNAPLREWGIYSEAKFKQEKGPLSPAQPKDIQQTSAQSGPKNTPTSTKSSPQTEDSNSNDSIKKKSTPSSSPSTPWYKPNWFKTSS